MSEKTITVLGAGIVGICCALELQNFGYKVELLDRRGAGEETSSGNAGILSLSSVTPLAAPEILSRLHRLAFNREADFLLHYAHLPWMLPWIIRFLARCNQKNFVQDGESMSRLTLPSVGMHLNWIKNNKATHLLNPVGVLKLYRQSKTFRRDSQERHLFNSCGVKHSLLDKYQIAELEPDLNNVFEQGVYIEESQSIRDPQALCKSYVSLFLERGGLLRRTNIRQITPKSHQWELTSDQGTETVSRLVVCLGAWTPKLLSSLGYDNPIVIERGYHTIFSAQCGKTLTRAIFDVDASYVMNPMNMGLRVTTGTNLTYRETGETPYQVDRVTPRVYEAFPVDKIILDKPWMGRRPSTPDSLPLIGPAPRHKNLWLAFGHAHMGLTVAPMTGKLIAQSVAGVEHDIPIRPYSPARYM